SDAGKPLRAPGDDLRHVGQGLNIVDDGGATPEADLGREGRPLRGFGACALDGMDQGCFFAADEGARAFANLEIEGKTGGEDILAQQATGAGVAFVAIADEVLRRLFLCPAHFPLDARGESGTTATAKAGARDLIDHPL